MWMVAPPPAVPLEGERAWTEDDVVVSLSETPATYRLVVVVVVVTDARPLSLGGVGGAATRPVAGDPLVGRIAEGMHHAVRGQDPIAAGRGCGD